MKQRFSSLDIKVIAHELSKSLVSLRAINIYDLSSRIFLIKFGKPGHRQHFLIDSGFRCHLTSFARTTANTPSAFVARLRKFLANRRLTAVSQVGTDRILELQFSDGRYRLFLEFYASGNIVLTDNELKIIGLLRQVHEGAEHEHLQHGGLYNLSERQNVGGAPPLTIERIKNGLQTFVDRQASGEQATYKKVKRKPGDTLRKALASCISEYPPMLLDHALRSQGFDVTLQPEAIVQDVALLEALVSATTMAGRTMDEIMASDVVKGHIFAKRSKTTSPSVPQSDQPQDPAHGLMYEDFHPFKPKHLENDEDITILDFDGFNRTVDEFYSSIEGQKLESRLAEREENARRKLENARLDQAKRLGGLQDYKELNVRKAQAIEANTERVTEATNAVNGLIAQGMDWVEVGKLVELEQKRGNPVAEYIKLPLKLHENTVTLLLGEFDDEADNEERDLSSASEPSDSEEEDDRKSTARTSKPKSADQRLTVDIDLALSPWANARQYYDQKRSAAAKEEKTLLASGKALQSTERKIEADLKKALKQEKEVLRPVRQAYWFEKFLYFISSDGYLVLGSRDAQQSEILYRRHMKTGDYFVHAELDGAIPVFIKNLPGAADAPVPPSTLSQAGNLSISTSTAWDSKAIMSAWWVTADCVSKNAAAGDYLAPGKFVIRGDKKYLPPAQLLLGFAVVFRISEASKAHHTKHRVPPQENEPPNDVKQPPNQDSDADTSHHDDVDVSKDHEAAHESVYDDSDEEHGSFEAHSDDEDHAMQRYNNPLQSQRPREDIYDVQKDRTSNHENYEGPPTRQPAGISHEDPTVNGEGAAEEHSSKSTSDEDEEVESSTAPDSTPKSISTDQPNTITTSTKPKGPVQLRGKRGKKKKLATKYAHQDDADREEAMRLLGSAAGQQRAQEEAAEKQKQEAEAAAQRQRRREQHARAELQRTAKEAEGGDDDDEDAAVTEVDLGAFVGTPLPGDEILEALPICAPWAALGRYKYKAKLQPGSTKKGKAVREVLSRWAADGADKKKVDDKAEDAEKIWPREIALIKAWKEAEVFGVVPVGKVRVMMAGTSSGGGGAGGGAKGKQKPQKNRSGKGSKKVR